MELTNSSIRELNDRVLPVAKTVTGKDFGADRDAWRGWWTDQLGYAYQSPRTQSKPTFTDVVVFSAEPPRTHSACFAAGTPVHTIDGPRAIDQLQVGDRVLSQDTTTGALSFQPVVAVHHNKPAPTLKLSLGGESLTATGIHRFWKAGQGWVMARDLKPGDVVRTVGGTARIESVESDTVKPVFNLDVARNRNFFVGQHGCLVYDFSIVQPVMTPFDGQADLAALESKCQVNRGIEPTGEESWKKSALRALFWVSSQTSTEGMDPWPRTRASHTGRHVRRLFTSGTKVGLTDGQLLDEFRRRDAEV